MDASKVIARIKNPLFWVTLIAVVGLIFEATGLNPETLTSWEALGCWIVSIFSNPFKLGSIVLSLVGVFINPATKGFKD